MASLYPSDTPTPTIDIKKVIQNPGALCINEINVQHGVIYKNSDVLRNAAYWHKFIIKNPGDNDRDKILKAILDHVQPFDLIPIFYTRENGSAFFLARNCGDAIEKLCKDNLLVENPSNKQNPFKLNLILRFTTTAEVKVDVSKNIYKIIKKRINPVTSVLNLDAFYQDPDLTEYCVLSQPKLMSYVLHFSRLLKPKSLLLTNNEIRTLLPMEALWGFNVTSLDLRNNSILSLTELEPLTQLPIVELWLEGNPLCDNYDEHTYVQRVKEYCPKIEKLDGLVLKVNGCVPFRRNFLCNHDGYNLVDQFLEYYFKQYDLRNRSSLMSFYHPNALFSMTANYHPMQLSSSTAQLKTYKTYGRNLLCLADLSRGDLNLFRGNQNIIGLFNKLPLTEHDPYTFTVDLMHYSETSAIIVVTGVFKELPHTILDVERFLSFNRCFVLEVIDGEYQIINEQYHISNALTCQESKAFKCEPPIKPQALPPARTIKEKNHMVNAMKLITNLTTEWAKKYLEDSNYDFKQALSSFVEYYKLDKIPADGFQN